MTGTTVISQKARRLAEALRAKVLAEAELIDRADGKITFEALPTKGENYDLRMTISTR